jgi:hypothetical protein
MSEKAVLLSKQQLEAKKNLALERDDEPKE